MNLSANNLKWFSYQAYYDSEQVQEASFSDTKSHMHQDSQCESRNN